MNGFIQLGIQLVSLLVAALGLWFLVKYVGYTSTIAQQSVFQTEATSKPAVIAIHDGTIVNESNGDFSPTSLSTAVDWT
jgi:hypothetical protein